jgi:hypothetical protein
VEAVSLLLVRGRRQLWRAQLEEVAVAEEASLTRVLVAGQSPAVEHWAQLAALQEEVAERF